MAKALDTFFRDEAGRSDRAKYPNDSQSNSHTGSSGVVPVLAGIDLVFGGIALITLALQARESASCLGGFLRHQHLLIFP
jgi:hypothetical protein